MSRGILIGAAALALIAGGLALLKLDPFAVERGKGTTATATVDALYYQHPDGLPSYSLTPKKAPDGRDYRAVPRGADTSFDDEDAQPVPAVTAERKIKYYRNPMGLPDTSPVPKKDSMGMAYIPVYEGEDDDGAVKVSPGRMQRTGVRSEPAVMQPVQSVLRAPGVIQLDERRVAIISMRMESWIQRIENVTTGSRVKAGQPLMHIYSPAFASAAAEYAAVLSSPGINRTPGIVEGARQRLLNLAVPQSVMEELERTAKAPNVILWTIPRDGIVLERNATEGMRAQPGDVLFRLADTSSVWAMLDVPERELWALSTGQVVSVTTRGFPGRTFAGTIKVIYPQLNRDTRTARVRVELANDDLALLPDMYVDADIAIGKADAVLSVPDHAVIDTGGRQVVFVDKGDGRFEPRDVKTGARGGGLIEIRYGLGDGERVVTSANFLIDAESNLKAALKGFSEAGEAQ